MSTSEPPEYPDGWTSDETNAVPVGPEPEATGVASSGGGPGGWGRAPRVEPLAIAALVWAVVSIAMPLLGTIVAFVLAARAADLIRRSRGEKSGAQYVTAARAVAGAVLAIWVVGFVAFLALRGGDSTTTSDVAVPTQPPATTVAVATTAITIKPITTTTKPPIVTPTAPRPTIKVVPPPATTAAPVTPVAPAVPTSPPPTAGPTTRPPTPPSTPPRTTVPPTTSPGDEKAAAVQSKLIKRTQLGPSNRDLPNSQRFAVSYTPGHALLVTWAINNGSVGVHPKGTPNCAGPPTLEPPAASTTTSSTSTTSTTTTPTTTTPTTTTSNPSPTKGSVPGSGRTTQQQARYEARQILLSIRAQLTTLKLDVTGLQLVGTYPLGPDGDSDVVQVLYAKATVQSGFADYKKAFTVPPGEIVQCLNPAFA
jgi:hypothetical protein